MRQLETITETNGTGWYTALMNSDAISQGSSLEWLQILKRAKKRASKVPNSHVLELRSESRQLCWEAGVTEKSGTEIVSKELSVVVNP